MGLSLREAAELANVSKSTIFRAIRAGRLSATRLEDNGFSIEPVEILRVYPPQRPAAPDNGHDTTPGGPPNAALEVEIRLLRELLEAANRDRDAWKEQAARIALVLPAPVSPKPWWRRLAG
jgi:excisionase family DNA binding protein